MDNVKELTVDEYRQLRGVSAVAVTRAMNKGKKLVGVESYSKVRRDWVLKVNIRAAKNNTKNILVIPE